VLSLASNGMLDVNQAAFKFLSHLEFLYLHDNYLSVLNANHFRNLSQLKELWIETNEIWSFDSATLVGLVNLEKVCFYHNPISQKQPSLLKNICNTNPKCIVYLDKTCQ
jgi:Leucine-rich repeat (LRR) protein